MKGLKRAVLIILGLFIIDYFHLFGLSNEFDETTSISNNLKSAFSSCLLPVVLPAIFFVVVWTIYVKSKNIKSLFLEFLFPLAIALYTLFSGIYGFYQIEPDLGNAIFNAANLLTLNSSVFQFSGVEGTPVPVNLWLVNARLMGGFFLAYAFFLALSLATGKENLNRLRFWFTRRIWKKPYYVVIGDTKKALFLALDFASQDKKVVFLHQEDNENIEGLLEGKDIYYMTGNVTSRTGLEKTYFELAEKVYVLNESDDENFRVCQEMVEIMLQKKHKKANWFVLMKDLRKRTLLTKLVRPLPANSTPDFPEINMKIIDINQNVARKSVLLNDSEALADQRVEIYQNIIFGFNELARAVVMQLLRIGHFPAGKRLQVQVYYEEKDRENIELFKAKHPELFQAEGDSEKWRSLKNYTFLSAGPILSFAPLPKADSQLISPEFDLYHLINQNAAVNIYVCLANGLDSAALLGTLLPRLKNEKSRFLKAYCYYNYLDAHEEQMIQERLSEITDNAISVTCFGNDIANCQISAIENEERDLLAKYIAYLYHSIYSNTDNGIAIDETGQVAEEDKKTFSKILQEIRNWKMEDINVSWDKTKEIDKESNRHAADHAILKFSLLGRSPKSVEKMENYAIADSEVKKLAEVEHRRWNAEKLLGGWLPVPYDLENKEWLAKKDKLRDQKFHFHLSDFKDLPPKEKGKDHTQIMGLPYILHTVYQKITI